MILVKRKMYLIAAWALVFFALGSGQSFAENLLSNSGFENDLQDWFQSGAGWQSQNQVVYTGQKAAQHTMPNLTEAGYYGFLVQAFDANAGQTYYATLYAKSDYSPIAQAAVGLQVAFLDSQNQILTSYQDVIGGQTDWKQLYLVASAPTGTAKVAFYAFAFGTYQDSASSGGQSYFDEGVLSLEYIDPPEEDFGLDNPGFENGLHRWGIDGGNWQAQTNHVLSGNYAAQNIIGTTPAGADEYFETLMQQQPQHTAVSPGDIFYATAYVKTSINVVSNASAGIMLDFVDENYQPIENGPLSMDSVGGDTDWSQVYVSAQAPQGAAKVRVRLFVWSEKDDPTAIGGEVYFDDAVLSEDYIAPPEISLSNSKFENGFNAWTALEPHLNPGSDLTWSLEEEVVLSGSYSAKNLINTVEMSDEALEYYATLSQEFSILPGQALYATLYAKTEIDPMSMAKAGLLVEFLDLAGHPIEGQESQDIIGGITDWRQLYVTAVAPPGAVKVRYSAMVFAQKNDVAANNGLVYFDQGALSVDFIAPPPAPEGLRNADFENGLHDWKITEPFLHSPNGLLNGHPATWQAQIDEVFIGSLSAQNTINMDLSFEADSYYAALKQELSVQQGDPVHATAWVKTDFHNDSSAVAGLKISVLDQEGIEISFLQETFAGTSDWRQLKVSLIAPEGAAAIHYIVFVWADQGDFLADGGIAYIDNAYLDFIYINHLGMAGGEDVFPQEIAENSYYTGAASTRATILHLLGQSPSQDEIYNMYHWSGSENDMLPSEIKTALNSEIGSPYHFSDAYQTDDQTEAIANFVRWVDFLPLGGQYCPAKVPVYGTLHWKTVRGISTHIKPHPAGQSMPDFTVHGLWINDPASSGLGFNVYQTIENFQLDYLPLANGYYRAVYGSLADLDPRAFRQKMQYAHLSLASAKPNFPLRKALLTQLRLRERQEQDVTDAPLSLKTITDSLPSELKMNLEFSSLIQQIQSIDVYHVFWKEEDKDYAIVALSRLEPVQQPIDHLHLIFEKRETSLLQLQLLKPQKRASILIEVNLQDGSYQQATWVQEEEMYPQRTQEQALALVEDYLNIQSLEKKEFFSRNVNVQESLRGISQVRLVWSRNFEASRFHPSYEISFDDGRVFYVHPNGDVELASTGSHFFPFLPARGK